MKSCYAAILAILFLAGCESPVERGLGKYISEDSRSAPSTSVKSVACDAVNRKVDKRNCVVAFGEDYGLPRMSVAVPINEIEFQNKFKLTHEIRYAFGNLEYHAEVSTDFEGATMPVDQAARALLNTANDAANLAVSAAGEPYWTKQKQLANQNTY